MVVAMAATLARAVTGAACGAGAGVGAGAACGGGRGHKQDVEPGRGAAEGTSCSGLTATRFRRSGRFAGVGRFGIDKVHFGLRLCGRSGIRSARISQSQCREGGCSGSGSGSGPVCLMRGVNGAFWEGADSGGSPANVHYTPQDEVFVKEGSVLLSLIREIEPLDISLISKDATRDSTSAMKRTISGMLGLLPSNQFQVTIETHADHLARLLVSSMMTGYTLRNAEYRLCLQRNLDLDEEASGREVPLGSGADAERSDSCWTDEESTMTSNGQVETCNDENREGEHLPGGVGEMSAEAASYIRELQAKLSAVSKELDACKRTLSSSELVGQENNELLDYLRSLKPEKVAELSQPSPEVHEVVEQVVAGILGAMAPKVAPQVPPFGANTLSTTWEESGSSEVGRTIPLSGASEVGGNAPLQFQAAVTVTSSRDYLARLLFWCTLMGYHMRGLEYRLELSRTLRLSGEDVRDIKDEKHDSQQDPVL